MQGGWTLLYDLIVVTGAALILGLVAEKLRQNAIIGYLVAGALVGPSALGLVQGSESVQVLAEIGVALLLFSIGLEFSWTRLKQLGKVAFFGGSLQILITIGVGVAVGLGSGMPFATAFAIGATLAMSSTAVVLRVLKDRAELDASHGKATLGLTLLQDLAVVPLVIAISLLGRGPSAPPTVGALLTSLGLFATGLVLVMSYIIPRVMDARTFTRNRELPILSAITCCMAAAWAANAVGLSAALGAFLAGMLLAENKFADQIRADILPFRTLFLTLFFASVGMLVDWAFLRENFALVLGVTLAVMVGKSLLTFAAIKPFVPSVITCAATGIATSQIGEFSFVLAQLAVEREIIDSWTFQMVVCVTGASLLIAPYAVSRAPEWARALAIRLVPGRLLAETERAQAPELTGHVIVVGFGEAGQAVSHALAQRDQTVLVLELSPTLVHLARGRGLQARIADATQVPNLLHAELPHAAALVVALPDVALSRAIISHSKKLAPHVPVAVRSRYHIHATELDVLGADVTVDEESLVGEMLGERVLKELLALKVRPTP